jgi:hypothetical protein
MHARSRRQLHYLPTSEPWLTKFLIEGEAVPKWACWRL